MDTQLKVFINPLFGEIRTAGTSDQPLFCLADVCRALSIDNSGNVKARLSQGGIRTVDTPTTSGIQPIIYINEPNLYRCIFQSRKKEAELFQDWVVSVVLPAIRKSGGYIATMQEDTPEIIMAKAYKIANDTLARHVQQLEEMRIEKESTEQQLAYSNDTLKRNAPKLEYYQTVLQSKNTYTTTQIAKELNMTAQKLNKILHARGLQYKQSGQWMLYEKYQNRGYTTTRTFIGLQEGNVAPTSYIMTVWTEKGRRAIHNELNPALIGSSSEVKLIQIA